MALYTTTRCFNGGDHWYCIVKLLFQRRKDTREELTSLELLTLWYKFEKYKGMRVGVELCTVTYVITHQQHCNCLSQVAVLK